MRGFDLALMTCTVLRKGLIESNKNLKSKFQELSTMVDLTVQGAPEIASDPQVQWTPAVSNQKSGKSTLKLLPELLRILRPLEHHEQPMLIRDTSIQ